MSALARRRRGTYARYLPEANTVELKIGTYDDIAPGVFNKLCGALASQGLQILSAEINTLADGLVFDRFWINDPDFPREPPPSRLADVRRAIEHWLKGPVDRRPAIRRVWRPGERGAPRN